jgi:hypothetical protein
MKRLEELIRSRIQHIDQNRLPTKMSVSVAHRLDRMMTERLLCWFLRATASVLIAAAVAVVLPTAAMDAIHEWLGFGSFPRGPIVEYLARSVSALYACLGACCWYVSGDVRRYVPLLRFSVPVAFAFAAMLIAIDVAAEMPTLWTVMEGIYLPVWTLVLWGLVRRMQD